MCYRVGLTFLSPVRGCWKLSSVTEVDGRVLNILSRVCRHDIVVLLGLELSTAEGKKAPD